MIVLVSGAFELITESNPRKTFNLIIRPPCWASPCSRPGCTWRGRAGRPSRPAPPPSRCSLCRSKVALRAAPARAPAAQTCRQVRRSPGPEPPSPRSGTARIEFKMNWGILREFLLLSLIQSPSESVQMSIRECKKLRNLSCVSLSVSLSQSGTLLL